MRSIAHAIVGCLLLGALPSATWAQCALDKLTAGDGDQGHQFGSAVAVSGDRILIGARNASAAYVFERSGSTWVESAKLVGAGGDQFGFSVDLDGGTAIVGANGDDQLGVNAGAAYVFELIGPTWTQVAKLTASDGVFGDNFGESVSVSGDVAVVGMHADDFVPRDPGTGYVFERIGGVWTETAVLQDPLSVDEDHFAVSVSVDGDRILLGARNDDVAAAEAGAAYVFEKQAGLWVQVDKLFAGDPAPGHFFGESVSLDGDKGLVGADLVGSGRVYVFRSEVGGWVQEAKLVPSDGGDGDLFGRRVSLEGNTALVGAPLHDGVGAAYVFGFDGAQWVEKARLTALDGEAGDVFGFDVAVQGDTAAVCSVRDDDGGQSSGSAYAHSVSETGCPALFAVPEKISAAAGGTHTFALDAGVAHQGKTYQIVGSLSGTTPGFGFGGFHVPLNPDGYFTFTVQNPSTPPLADSQGVLDAEGRATATFTVPPGATSFVGTTVSHAFGVLNTPSGLLFVSNPVQLVLTP